MTATPAGVPPLDELSGAWLEREELNHLPSLRNQSGQAHVNDDLSSLSWIAFPPYSVGYHTGALRIDGHVLRTEAYRWSAWGVQRRNRAGAVEVETDTRLGYEQSSVNWRLQLRNPGAEPVTVTVEQELLAMAGHSDTGWGWLYGTPWNNGSRHDFFTTERIRTEAASDHPRQVQFDIPDARWLRLGRPRDPGIQRDEDDAAMLLEFELPDHTSPDSGRVRPPGISGAVRLLELTPPGELARPIGDPGAEYRITPDGEQRLAPVPFAPGSALRLQLRLDPESRDGVVLTHGNHPDSLQLGVTDGVLWLSIAGEKISTTAPLPTGEWIDVCVGVHTQRAELSVHGQPAVVTTPWWGNQRWTASRGGGAVLVVDSQSVARSAFAFSREPDAVVIRGARANARWTVELQPGETTSWGVALEIGDDLDRVAERALASSADFHHRFDAIAERWRRTWDSAFTPGNTEFSGYLPALDTPDADLARTYYLGVLLAVYLRNTTVSPLGPVFLTGGPRLGATITFYWDQSEWARTAALLEPAGMRSWILAALAQPYESSHSFDTHRLQPIGNHYASNDRSLFHVVESYIGVTGDLDLLFAETRGRTVLDHLRALAYRPVEHPARFGDGVLFDFGRDAWELLECVPNYRDGVVSFNAGYVGMLRSLSTLLRMLGETEEADAAEAHGERLAAAVLDQYAGGGRWNIAHPDGDEIIGHCLDFEFVAGEMADDLTSEEKREMVQFVSTHLIEGDWLRALSPDDPIAPLSDRPDHGAAGAFAACSGAVAYGLFRLGEQELALGMLRRAHRATSGAVWGQAMEAMGDGSYRVAERGVSNRESNAAVSVTEAVIAGLFGIDAGFDALGRETGSLESAAGTLRNVRAVGFDLARPQSVTASIVESER